MYSRRVRRWVAQGVLAACVAGAVVGWAAPELLRAASTDAGRTPTALRSKLAEAQQAELRQTFAHMEGRLTHRLRIRRSQRSARRTLRAPSRGIPPRARRV